MPPREAPEALPKLKAPWLRVEARLGAAGGLVDDAGLQWCPGGELDGSPDEDHGDGGERVRLGKVEGDERGYEGQEGTDEEGPWGASR